MAKNKYVGPAFKNYRQNFLIKTASASFFGLILIICFFLAYLFPATLFLTIPFIILPFLLAFIADNSTIHPRSGRISGIFIFFPLYYTPPMFGGFRVLMGFLKSLVTYIVISTVLVAILYLTIGQYDASFVEILNNIKNSLNSEDLLKIIGDLQGNQTFILISNISEISALFGASLIFIHHIFTNSLKFYFNLIQPKPMPMKVLNYVHRFTVKRNRKMFYKDIFSSFWFVYLTFIIGYASGAALATLVIHLDSVSASLFSLFIGVFFILYLLPYVYNVLILMADKYNPKYLESIIEISKKEFEELKKQNFKRPNQDKMQSEEEYKKVMEELEKMVNDVKEKTEDQSEDKK